MLLAAATPTTMCRPRASLTASEAEADDDDVNEDPATEPESENALIGWYTNPLSCSSRDEDEEKEWDLIVVFRNPSSRTRTFRRTSSIGPVLLPLGNAAAAGLGTVSLE